MQSWNCFPEDDRSGFLGIPQMVPICGGRIMYYIKPLLTLQKSGPAARCGNPSFKMSSKTKEKKKALAAFHRRTVDLKNLTFRADLSTHSRRRIRKSPILFSSANIFSYGEIQNLLRTSAAFCKYPILFPDIRAATTRLGKRCHMQNHTQPNLKSDVSSPWRPASKLCYGQPHNTLRGHRETCGTDPRNTLQIIPKPDAYTPTYAARSPLTHFGTKGEGEKPQNSVDRKNQYFPIPLRGLRGYKPGLLGVPPLSGEAVG